MDQDFRRHPTSELPPAARLEAAGWSSVWLEGDPSALAPPLVALIGTRDADAFGTGMARRLAAELVRAGAGVLSGGALGIDAAAHQGALVAHGRTVVVLPSGLEYWYPRRHERLYRQVIEEGGALVSQFTPDTPPCSWTFPRRNELLAALADLVVVVQAPAASGALGAAELALRLGRRVMAVPASPADRRGAGCLRLLRVGARPCTCAADVLEQLEQPEGPLFRKVATPRKRRDPAPSAGVGPGEPAPARVAIDPGPLDEDGCLVYDSLASTPRHVDEIARLTGLPASRIQRALLTLVLSGLCEDAGGGMFHRARG